MVDPDLRTTSVRVRLTEDEQVTLRDLAQANGQTISDWIRQQIRKEAKKGLRPVARGKK